MRIVGGTLRGRAFAAPKGTTTRPTSDRTREAIFNILTHNDFGGGRRDSVRDAVVLDAFCGSGAFAYEALSRGAAHAYLVDTDQAALDAAEENAEILGLLKAVTLIKADATKPQKAKQKCGLVFFDPPYRKRLIDQALPVLIKGGWVTNDALLVCETERSERLELDNTRLMLSRTYGKTAIHIFKMASAAQKVFRGL